MLHNPHRTVRMRFMLDLQLFLVTRQAYADQLDPSNSRYLRSQQQQSANDAYDMASAVDRSFG